MTDDSPEKSFSDGENPQAFGNEKIQLGREYRLNSLVQIPMLGMRIFYWTILAVLIWQFGLGIPDSILDRFFYQPSIFWLLVILTILWPLLAYRFWAFELRQYDIIVKSGLLFRREISIPWSRIQQVDSKANPLDRVCNLKRLVLHSAGSRAGRTSIPGIQSELAEALQSHLANIVERFHGSKSDRLEKFKAMMKGRATGNSEVKED